MKKGSDCYVVKYVYRKLPSRGGFWSYHELTGEYSSLSQDFPAAAFVAQNSSRFKLVYMSSDDEVTIWIDKHGNIIVRILRNNYKQLKLIFK